MIILIDVFVWTGSYQLIRCENSCVFIKGGLFWVVFLQSLLLDLSLVTWKPVFGVCDQVRLKPAYSTTETSKSLEISAIANRSIKLLKARYNANDHKYM